MTKLPPPEQWVLCKMSEMEVAEMIEKYIDYYTEDDYGNHRPVHLPTQFVRHFNGTTASCRQWSRSQRPPLCWRMGCCWPRRVSIVYAASSSSSRMSCGRPFRRPRIALPSA